MTGWATPEEMREAADRLRPVADRIASPATRSKLLAAADELLWQAARDERYPMGGVADPGKGATP